MAAQLFPPLRRFITHHPICPRTRGAFSAQRQIITSHSVRAICNAASIDKLDSQATTESISIAERFIEEPSPGKNETELEDPMGGMLHEHLKLLQRRPKERALSGITSAPIFTYPVLKHAEKLAEGSSETPFAQYALLAADAEALQHAPEKDPRMFYNVATPTSFFICGSQGSGKSHSLSCILENCLIPSETLGRLPNPLTGIMFHYDSYNSDVGGTPSEAAYLSSDPRVKVRVLCSPTNVRTIKNTYSSLENVTVEELRLDETNLNTKRMLDLMGLDKKNPPLYMHIIQRILREMHISQQKTGGSFDYGKFLKRIQREKLDPGQLDPLRQRLDILESFMIPDQTHTENSNLGEYPSKSSKKQAKKDKARKRLAELSKWVEKAKKAGKVEGSVDAEAEEAEKEEEVEKISSTNWTLKSGELLIVDLSCPCIPPAMASAVFNICLSIFLEQDSSVGRVVALDEAHKYMDDSSDSASLTDTLLAAIRLQRHLGLRIIISTQEPTVSRKLLDLSSISIIHQFTSPEWFNALRKHLAGVALLSKALHEDRDGEKQDSKLVDPNDSPDQLAHKLFARILKLNTGEALVFAPRAVVGLEEEVCPINGTKTTYKYLSQDALHVTVRSRITTDGGRSVLAC